MDKIGIRINSSNNMAKCIKIVRKYCDMPIGQIKDTINNNRYIIEGKYVDEEDILLILKMYEELCENNIVAELYEHDRKTNVEFLNNLVSTYYSINEELQSIIDQTVDE